MQGRTLTEQEIVAARKVFAERIDYVSPRIIAKRHPLAVRRGQILAPDGNIYWPGACDNLMDAEETLTASIFIHEMTHVMQHQHGVPVLMKGFVLHARRLLSFGRYDPYYYRLDMAKKFSAYNIEQQAEIAIGIYLGWFPNIIDYADRPLRARRPN